MSDYILPEDICIRDCKGVYSLVISFRDTQITRDGSFRSISASRDTRFKPEVIGPKLLAEWGKE